ncbi:hypothetical protein EVAR_58114_1 [Eumeta japonica]|uniref:Uncharacterized protein n=1 Tax=Eumeta variegata TaxID=151549 RepID=A0A4C1YKE9_EUMVA|nr:hypothetical protein EVAR_58114_1 [Eumeta japonica]
MPWVPFKPNIVSRKGLGGARIWYSNIVTVSCSTHRRVLANACHARGIYHTRIEASDWRFPVHNPRLTACYLRDVGVAADTYGHTRPRPARARPRPPPYMPRMARLTCTCRMCSHVSGMTRASAQVGGAWLTPPSPLSAPATPPADALRAPPAPPRRTRSPERELYVTDIYSAAPLSRRNDK